MRRRKPQDLKIIAGTDQPCRRPVRMVPEINDGERPKPPVYLDKAGKNIFNRYVDIFEARNQSIVGAESLLGILCGLEVGVGRDLEKGLAPSAATIQQIRMLARDFYLTPSFQVGFPDHHRENPFARNGKRPTKGIQSPS